MSALTSIPAPEKTIAFQGSPGAYSHLTCKKAYPDMTPLPCATFGDAFAAVRDGKAKYAMIPIDNSTAGRVADIHGLLPKSGLHIVGEHFWRVEHNLLACEGATFDSIKTVHSHIQALSQCSNLIAEHGYEPVPSANTASAALMVAKEKDPTQAAIGSSLAGEINGLVSLKANIENNHRNTTRFVVMSREGIIPPIDSGPVVTSLVFRVKNIPAALYKALGGFSTNGINLSKLESYLVGGRFIAAQFYVEAEGHPEERLFRLALKELSFFSHEVTILGTYSAHPYRFEDRKGLKED